MRHRSENFSSASKLLLNHQAQVGSRDRLGRDPLHKACQSGNVDTVRVLVKHDADVEAVDYFQRRPIDTFAEALTIIGPSAQALFAETGHHEGTEF